ncbi:MAG: DUF6345 domain-containing protein [Mycobacterium sp.]
MTARKTAVRTAEKVEGSASAPVENPVAAPAPKPQHAPKGDSPRLVLDRSADRNPFTELPAEESDEAGAVRGGANAYGAFSIETFANSGGLTYTHEDAQGFYDYVKQFAAPNFWYRDGGVAVWAYYETYDNWQDTYGMDAVNVVYHSGHGGRLADGRVWFPLGADWSGQGTNAWSDQMRLGNERVNYIFWSTCFACPVFAPLNPITTWNSANLGFRMLFGYETTSVDDPNYGKYFFQEWNKNKSFSTAWLDASWRISHSQVPSVVACGANQADADARLSGERLFSWAHVPKNWWSWRWYYASRLAPPNIAARERNVTVPQDMSSAVLRPIDVNARVLRSAVDRFGMRLTIPREVRISPSGASQISDGESTLAFGADGSVEAHLAEHNYDNRDQISLTDAAAVAQEALGLYGLARDNQLVFDKVRYEAQAGGSAEGDGELLDPSVTGTTVQFRQLINGLPVVTPGAGEVRVTVDNDGKVTHVANSARVVDRLTRGGGNPTPAPDGSVMRRTPPGDDDGVEQRLGASWAQQMGRWAIRGQMPVGYSLVPGTTEVGYAIDGDQAVLVATREIEVDFGQGLFKRYRIEAPLA